MKQDQNFEMEIFYLAKCQTIDKTAINQNVQIKGGKTPKPDWPEIIIL